MVNDEAKLNKVISTILLVDCSMPRARGRARTTFPRRRAKRYRTKWTHHVIPRRFKLLLPSMWSLLEPELELHVECEEPTIAELQAKGVPEEEWPYYIGYMKRMLALYQNYTGATLQLEKTNLIEEYVLRGKDRNVLEQVQVVAERCYLQCADVLACLEGDYTTYTQQWNQIVAGLVDTVNYGYVNSSGDRVFIRGDWRDFVILNLQTGAVILDVNLFGQASSSNKTMDMSVLGRYVIVVWDATNIRIYKDGALLQTLTVVGADFTYGTFISYDGKYIIAVDGNNSTVYCWEGS